MNIVVISRETASICGQENHLPKYQTHAVRRIAAANLWIVLALLAGGINFTTIATAQDAAWQDEQQPKRKPRTVAPDYPDEELPIRKVALDDDSPAITPPVPRGAVDSPSNQPAMRAKPQAAGDATDSEPAQPARKKAPTPNRSEAADGGNTLVPSDPFGSHGEECDEGSFGYSGPDARSLMSNRIWFRGEALLWWARGGQTPPLLTTSPGSTIQSQAGVLGEPNTTILFGNQELNTGLHAGARMSFGLWLDRCEESGIEFSYLVLGENDQAYSNQSTGIPILARPFFNTSTGAQDSQLIAYPNSFGGTFNATSTENFQGAEALWRRAIVKDNENRVDFLAGYRYQRLTDGLQIADSVTSSGSASAAPAGTTVNVSDTFHTRNDFNGADIGFATQWHPNRWSLDTNLKLGIGQTQTQVLINGWTTVVTNGTSVGYTGGQLALPSNIGTHDSRQFTMLPEIGMTLGYDFTPRLKGTVGYTLLYWSGVARPGDQIDQNLDAAQFPPPTGTGIKPAFALHTSDFWAQGINVGLDYRF